MFQPVEEAIAVGTLYRCPRIFGGTHGGRGRQVARVARKSEERSQMRSQPVDRRQVQRMIAFAHIVGAAVHLHAFNRTCDVDVRICVPVAMRIRRQIIRHKIAADLDVLRDRLAVVASHSWRKILRRLDAARRRLNRIAGNRNRRAWPSRIRVEQVPRGENFHRRIGRHHIVSCQIGRDDYRLRNHRFQLDLEVAASGRHENALLQRLEIRRVHTQPIGPGRNRWHRKSAFCVAHRLLRTCVDRDQTHHGSCNRPANRIGNVARDSSAICGSCSRQRSSQQRQDAELPELRPSIAHISNVFAG